MICNIFGPCSNSIGSKVWLCADMNFHNLHKYATGACDAVSLWLHGRRCYELQIVEIMDLVTHWVQTFFTQAFSVQLCTSSIVKVRRQLTVTAITGVTETNTVSLTLPVVALTSAVTFSKRARCAVARDRTVLT